jgi:hypothetical protein
MESTMLTLREAAIRAGAAFCETAAAAGEASARADGLAAAAAGAATAPLASLQALRDVVIRCAPSATGCASAIAVAALILLLSLLR